MEEDGHHANLNNIIYRKEAVHRTEIEKLFLPTKGFNTNLVQFHLLYHIISNMHISFTCLISHVHRRAPKAVLHAQNLVH